LPENLFLELLLFEQCDPSLIEYDSICFDIIHLLIIKLSFVLLCKKEEKKEKSIIRRKKNFFSNELFLEKIKDSQTFFPSSKRGKKDPLLCLAETFFTK